VDYRLVGIVRLVSLVSIGCSPSGGWFKECGGVGWVVFGMLLGPEGSDVSLVAFSSGFICCLYCVFFGLWGLVVGVCGGVLFVC